MNDFNYKNLTPFKWFVLENFPFIENDFDAINNYHLFSKVVEYLNNTINNVNVLGNLVEQFSDYFDNLDVQEEINNKLDEMATDGTLTNLVKNYVDPIYQNYETEINGIIEQQNTNISNQNSNINLLEARMDEFTHLPNGSTSGDAELADGRITWDGNRKTNIGTAIREQVGNYYPFIKKPTINEVLAIKKFVFSSYISKDIKLSYLFKKRGANNVYSIQINDGTNDIALLNVVGNNYTEIERNYFNKEGYTGYFDIKWDEIEDGFGTNFSNKNYKFMDICFEDNVQENNYNDIILPSKIPVVVNREIRLEYYNAIKCNNINEFLITNSVNNSQLQNIATALKIKTTDITETNETINVYNNKNELVTHATTKIKSIADNFSNTINAIFIGDSMTNAGYFLAELKRMLGNKINLYGTRTTVAKDSLDNNVSVVHEGRPGWNSTDYITTITKNGISNPFYNPSSSSFDFNYYMNNQQYSNITDVFLLLGTNDGAIQTTTFINNLNTIFNSILDYDSNIRLHVMTPIPNIKNGYGWGIRNNINYITFKNYMYNLSKAIINSYDEETGYYIIPTHLNIDCWYDFPHTEVNANQRNPEQIIVGNDNVHPNRYGYYRMSDMIYADILENC